MGSTDPLDSMEILSPLGMADTICQQNEQVWELLTIVMVLFLLVLVQAGVIFWAMTRKRKINPADIVELQGIQIDTLAKLDEKYRCTHVHPCVSIHRPVSAGTRSCLRGGRRGGREDSSELFR